MRRPVAVFGGVYLLTQLAAVLLPPAAFLPLAAAFLCVGIVACANGRRGYLTLVPAAVLIGFCVQCAGFWFQVRPVMALADRQIQVIAEVTGTEPGYAEDTVRARLRLLRAADGSALPGSPTIVEVEAFTDCEPGDRFLVSLRTEHLTVDRYFYSNLADGVYLQAECTGQPELIGRSRSVVYAMYRLQKRFAENTARYLPQEVGGTLAAMTSGDKTFLPQTVSDDYNAAGISHLLVVSGLHLNLICGFFSARAGRFRRLRALASVALVLFMMLLTGLSPSVLRAGIGALILQIGNLLLLPADPLTSLGIAAVLISLQGPYAVCDLALQLSFAATAGVVLAGELTSRIQVKRDACPQWKKWFLAAGIRCGGLVLPTLFAALFTLPIQLIGGLPVSGVSLPANLLALPLVGLCVVLGLLAGLCGFVPQLAFAARAFSLAGGVLMQLLNKIAAFCAELPLAQLPLKRDYTLCVLAAVSMVLFAALRLKQPRRGAICVLLVLVMGSLWGGAAGYNVVEITLIGSASNPCVVALQNGQALVAFRGGESNARQVEDYLANRGISLAELVIDLRTNASSQPPAAEESIKLSSLGQYMSQSARVCDIMATIVRLKDSGLLMLEISGYRVAVPVGKVVSGTPARADTVITGSTEPGNLCAATLITRIAADWQTESDTKVYYAPREATILIRPGRAAVMRGGRYVIQ